MTQTELVQGFGDDDDVDGLELVAQLEGAQCRNHKGCMFESCYHSKREKKGQKEKDSNFL